MKNFCELIFALAVFVFINVGFAQNAHKTSALQSNKLTWQQYDSLAAVNAFNRDTISALENYQKSLELNPKNENARKNLVKLNYYYMKAVQSFYHNNP